MTGQNIKPRFEVHKLEGTRMRVIAKPKVDPERKDKNGYPLLLGGFDYSEVEEDAGYMVYFPNGSSIRVRTNDELVAMGFANSAELVDMNSGEIVGQVQSGSLKAVSEQKNARSHRTAAQTTVAQATMSSK